MSNLFSVRQDVLNQNITLKYTKNKNLMFKKFVEFSYDDTSMINHDPERFRPRGDNSVKPNLKIPGSKDISESGAGQKSR